MLGRKVMGGMRGKETWKNSSYNPMKKVLDYWETWGNG